MLRTRVAATRLVSTYDYARSITRVLASAYSAAIRLVQTRVARKANLYPMEQVDMIPHAPSKKLAPERRLMIAVLEDAINCVTKYRVATDGPSRRLFDEEQQWLFSKETRWPYSFECICDFLDLDADAVRQGLRLAPA